MLTRVRAAVAREAKFVKEDVDKVRQAVTPSRLAHWLVVGGAATSVAFVAQWQAVVAGVIAGVLLVVYGLIFVDVDAGETRQRRRRRRPR